MKTKRLVFLPDIHIPHQINLKPVFSFLKDYKPHIVIIGGDYVDANYLANWSQRRIEYFLEDAPREDYDNDIKTGNKILDKIDEYCVKSNTEKEFLEGNHEERLRRLLHKFPDKKRTIMDAYDYKRDLNLKQRGYKWHRLNQVIRKGRLYFTHGVFYNKYHAEKHSRIYGKNLRYGHAHDIQVYSKVSPIDHHERTCMSCGCLCSLNPAYLRGKPNKWQNAIYYATINQSGTFSEHLTKIVGGRFFRAEGKTYGDVY